ncbi:hypothetical protein [Actinoplanes sp. NPDC023714]|uniref:hypothetical protein n=1 Tax=Actinoplanes sp. NPDC023714 TaxID=3154322 RepID=UPI003408C716
MPIDAKTDVNPVAAVRAALARFDEAGPGLRRDPEAVIRWAGALLDGGDEQRALEALLGVLHREELPVAFDAVATRIGADDRRRTLARALLGSGCVTRSYGTPWPHPYRAVAATVVRLAGRDRDLEEAALRTAREHTPEEWRESPYRVGDVVAALAEAHRDEPAYLDHLAGLLAGDDRRHLGFAAALLGPAGLDETRRLCGTVADEAGEALTAAFAGAGRFDEALAFAVTLGADARQRALLRLATPGMPAGRATALLAAYRKCPKASRQRADQAIYRSRQISLFLTLDRVDDALAALAQMPDLRFGDLGHGPRVLHILRRFADRPEEATPERLRAVLDVLTGEKFNLGDLGDVVVEAVRLVHGVADATVRADLVATYLPRMRATLRSATLTDIALAWARVDEGDHAAADPLFAARAADGRPSLITGIMLRLAPAARLASRDPELFGRLLAKACGGVIRFRLTGYGADELRLVAEALAGAPYSYPPWIGTHVSAHAAEIGDRRLLAAAAAHAPDREAAQQVGRDIAVVLARAGELAAATEVAELCGLTGQEKASGQA